MARKEKDQEILRTVRLSDGSMIEPGQEDELEQALVDQAEANGVENFDVHKELTRLERKGAIRGFAEPGDDADLDNPDADLRANARHRKAAQVQEPVPVKAGKPPKASRRVHKAGPTVKVAKGRDEAPDSDSGPDDEE